MPLSLSEAVKKYYNLYVVGSISTFFKVRRYLNTDYHELNNYGFVLVEFYGSDYFHYVG